MLLNVNVLVFDNTENRYTCTGRSYNWTSTYGSSINLDINVMVVNTTERELTYHRFKWTSMYWSSIQLEINGLVVDRNRHRRTSHR